MVESHPEIFQIEIDHKRLCRYLRLQAFLGLSALFLFFGAFFGFASHADKRNHANIESVADFMAQGMRGAGIGTSIGLLLALFAYFVFYHFPAKRQACAVQLRVEGQYLRFRDGFLFRRDRKLHFRAIVDYSCFEGPLMRWCDIGGLEMTTMAGGQGSILRVPGVKDAGKVQNVLTARPKTA